MNCCAPENHENTKYELVVKDRETKVGIEPVSNGTIEIVAL